MQKEGVVTSRLCLVALVVWLLTVSALAWMFVKGWTTPGSDHRAEIILAPSERDVVLAEMRMLLKAVHGVITGLSGVGGDVSVVEGAARAAGMAMAVDVNPVIMTKLPLAFKQMGMSIHQDMDALADAIVRKESPPQLLQRLSSMTARCTACHDMYRFSGSK
jgi:hypothetical protein